MKSRDIVIGNDYNGVIVIGEHFRKGHSTYFPCKCPVCGKVFNVRASRLGKTRSCEDCSGSLKINDLTGRRFGRLRALSYCGRKNGRTLWRCVCDCGNYSIVGYSNLINGVTRSCGCLEKENFEKSILTHSNRKSADSGWYGELASHPLYSSWQSMLNRCYNKRAKSYNDYGGRGIRVCDRWLPENKGFQMFVEDMGARPTDRHTIDRIDVNGDYSPENCRWATVFQQSTNKRKSVYVYYSGYRIPLLVLCEKLGLNYWTVAHQVIKGFDINEIIKHPGGTDFRTKEYRGMTGLYKNFNKTLLTLPSGIHFDKEDMLDISIQTEDEE